MSYFVIVVQPTVLVQLTVLVQPTELVILQLTLLTVIQQLSTAPQQLFLRKQQISTAQQQLLTAQQPWNQQHLATERQASFNNFNFEKSCYREKHNFKYVNWKTV